MLPAATGVSATVVPFSSRSLAIKRAEFLIRTLEALAPLQPDVPQPEEPQVTVETDSEIQAREAALLQQQLQQAETRGRQLALQEIAGAMDSLAAALDAAGAQLNRRAQELERALVRPFTAAAVELATELARQKLMSASGLQAYIEHVLESVREAALVEPTTVALHMHPRDIATLGPAAQSLAEVRLVADELVSPGGVSLKQADTVIDDSFESRLRELRETALSTAADLLRAPAS